MKKFSAFGDEKGYYLERWLGMDGGNRRDEVSVGNE